MLAMGGAGAWWRRRRRGHWIRHIRIANAGFFSLTGCHRTRYSFSRWKSFSPILRGIFSVWPVIVSPPLSAIRKHWSARRVISEIICTPAIEMRISHENENAVDIGSERIIRKKINIMYENRICVFGSSRFSSGAALYGVASWRIWATRS